MNANVHVVEAKWREAIILSLNEQVRAINDWLDHAHDLEDLFTERNDMEFVTNLRGVSGLVRSKRDDILRESEKLSAKSADLRSTES